MEKIEKTYRPLVSIITPMYNCESYLFNTFAGVLNQTYDNWEWIIVDDGSTDQSLSIAKKMATDKRIRILSLNGNYGAARARNVGLDNATGDYISFLDADDELDLVYLERQVAFIKDHGPIVTGAYRRSTENTVTSFYPPRVITAKSILKGNPLSCLTTMYDFRVFHYDRFDESIIINEDFLFWVNLLNKGYLAYGNQYVMATYKLHSGSKNINKIKLIKPTLYIFRKRLGKSFFKSVYYVFCMSMYSYKKYKNVK